MWKKIVVLSVFLLLILIPFEFDLVSSSSLSCPDGLRPCADKYCYNPSTHSCSEAPSNISCIATCGHECYNPGTNDCINDTICDIGNSICLVKFDAYYGNLVSSPGLRCYNQLSVDCLNHTLCHQKGRTCNGQCILYGGYLNWPQNGYQGDYRVCASNNVTVCTMPQRYDKYRRNQVQACNGTCIDLDLGLQHCVNDSVKCTSECNGICYNKTLSVCLNGTICNIGQNVCLTEYDSYSGHPLSSPHFQCYDPLNFICIDRALCSKDRLCNGKCIVGSYAAHQVCANDKRTLCNLTNSYQTYYRRYPMHLCMSVCYETSIYQCVDDAVSCIDETCADRCYDSNYYVCVNKTVCEIGSDACEVRYDSYSGEPITPTMKCYDTKTQVCLNHTICSSDRICKGNCITGYSSQYSVCANDTICGVSNHFTYYKPNQIQLCNGTCFDTGNPVVKHCVNGSVECISKCSGSCYDLATHICINNTLCYSDQHLCYVNNHPYCYYETEWQCLNGTLCWPGYNLCYPGGCYNPSSQKCLDGVICSNNRVCNEKCITDSYQVCANDKKTICNVTKPYSYYKPNQIQICLGVCFDSAIQQCTGDPNIICVEDPGNIICIHQFVNSSTTTTNAITVSTTRDSFSTTADTTTNDLESLSTDYRTETEVFLDTSATTIDFVNASTTSMIPTFTTSPIVSSCYAKKSCESDADCCTFGSECQCYHHNETYEYGACLNPFTKPICSSGCPESECLSDGDCCKCQCGTITVTNVYRSAVVIKQCVPRL